MALMERIMAVSRDATNAQTKAAEAFRLASDGMAKVSEAQADITDHLMELSREVARTTGRLDSIERIMHRPSPVVVQQSNTQAHADGDVALVQHGPRTYQQVPPGYPPDMHPHQIPAGYPPAPSRSYQQPYPLPPGYQNGGHPPGPFEDDPRR